MSIILTSREEYKTRFARSHPQGFFRQTKENIFAELSRALFRGGGDNQTHSKN